MSGCRCVFCVVSSMSIAGLFVSNRHPRCSSILYTACSQAECGWQAVLGSCLSWQCVLLAHVCVVLSLSCQRSRCDAAESVSDRCLSMHALLVGMLGWHASRVVALWGVRVGLRHGCKEATSARAAARAASSALPSSVRVVLPADSWVESSWLLVYHSVCARQSGGQGVCALGGRAYHGLLCMLYPPQDLRGCCAWPCPLCEVSASATPG